MLPDTTLDDAAALLAELQAAEETLATAESCTGGLIAAALTAVPGSSATVLAGFVTYSNEAKASMLGVPPASRGLAGVPRTSPWAWCSSAPPMNRSRWWNAMCFPAIARRSAPRPSPPPSPCSDA